MFTGWRSLDEWELGWLGGEGWLRRGDGGRGGVGWAVEKECICFSAFGEGRAGLLR